MQKIAVGVTGSRSARMDYLPHKQVIWDALREFHERLTDEYGLGQFEVTLFEGEADGADQIFKKSAEILGWTVSPHEADWRGPCRDTCQPNHRQHYKRPAAMRIHTYCPAAGNYRNQEMVDLVKPYLPYAIWFATPLPRSRGTWDCVRRAKDAGIEVVIKDLPEKPRGLTVVR